MQIKDLDELEKLFNEIGINLDQIKSLSKILLDSLCSEDDINSHDVKNLTSILNDRIKNLKEKFRSMEKDLHF